MEGASVYCDDRLCCHEPASNYSRIKSGKFGSFVNCDTSNATLTSFAEYAKDLKPDFIIWTGDNAEHNNYNSSQEEVYFTTREIKNIIDYNFGPDIVVYPVIGNHEVYPNDLWKPGNEQIFAELGQIYKDYFTEQQAFESFSKYGYYTERHPGTNLRIVALNCLYCDSVNYHLMGTTYEEAKAEFIWLEQVLRDAEANGEYVYILDHFPINGDFTLYECSKRLRALFDRFDYIIRGYFSGHTHREDISPVRRYFEPRPIINLNYIASSLTYNDGGNPSFRIYNIDSKTWNVIDYDQYRMNLTSSNEKGIADWYLSYKATDLFNVSDMTHIEEMTKINVEGEYILRRHADAATEKQMHDKKEIKKAQCTITTDSFEDYFKCTEQGIFNLEFFYKTLSDISGEWGKNPEEGE
jgi:3',5'-cyclic AMP phosphodiesterase CpdA